MDADFWMSLAICVALVALALWLVRVHWEHWQEVDADSSLPPWERDHLRRRYRRRMQTSTMLGFVGVAVLAGRLFPPDEPSLVTILYWTGVILLVLWMGLLALADMIATRIHYGIQRRKTDSERDRIEAQLRRFREEHPSQSPGHFGDKSGPESNDRDKRR